MNVITNNDVQTLTRNRTKPCVSILMPIHVTGWDNQQNPVRLKNLAREAEERLVHHAGIQPEDAQTLLKPVHKLSVNGLLRTNTGKGFAVYLAPGVFHFFFVPTPLEESLVVGDSFSVKPLLSSVSGNDPFYVLALSQNRVRLLRGTRFGIDSVNVDGMPTDIGSALNYQQREKVGQFHSSDRYLPGKQGAVFRGQGSTTDEANDDLRQFCRLVDDAMRPVLRDSKAPLVLATVDYLASIYRQVASYPHLVERLVPGNPDHLRPDQLHRRALPIALNFYKQARATAWERFSRVAGTQRAATETNTIVGAAHEGRIDTLFLDPCARQWGTIDPTTREVQLHVERQPGDEDLVNFAAMQTLLHGGTVFATDERQPPVGDSSMAAMLRY